MNTNCASVCHAFHYNCSYLSTVPLHLMIDTSKLLTVRVQTLDRFYLKYGLFGVPNELNKIVANEVFFSAKMRPICWSSTPLLFSQAVCQSATVSHYSDRTPSVG